MSKYRVQCCTYNGHLSKSSKPGEPDVSSWLSPTLARAVGPGETKAAAPDLVAIGFQEMIPLHLALAGFSRTALDLHESQLQRAVESHSGESYSLIAKHTLAGIALLVFARDSTVTHSVVDVRVATAGFGIGGLMGNKGAVGVRVVLDPVPEGNDKEKPDSDEEGDGGESFTFVTAHLAAHQGQCARRAADYQSLVERLVFTPLGKSPHFLPGRQRNVFKQLERVHPKSMGGPTLQIYDTSYLFVFGDLNYRIETSTQLTEAKIASSLDSNLPLLLESDQLAREQAEERTLHHLHEGPIAFAPTYKFALGTDTYKLKKRIPGWCDRVLFATWADKPAESGAEVELYSSVMQFRGSDHKPVTAVVSLPIGGSRNARLPRRAPFAVDPEWRTKLMLGWVADRAVGSVWCLLVLLGAGRDVRLGVVNLLLLTLAGAYRDALPRIW